MKMDWSKYISMFSYPQNEDKSQDWPRTESFKTHPFHMVDPSPWPFCVSIAALTTVIGFVKYIHFYSSINGFLFGLASLMFFSTLWWRDVIEEATFDGRHTKKVQQGLKIGFVLFIISEVMFFFSFFWAYFHSSLVPTPEIGCKWPPEGIVPFNPWTVPLLNTIILLLSGASITSAHHYLIRGIFSKTVIFLFFTILLGIFFTILQYMEYVNSTFTISDGVYGSTFFMITGFHGFHVIVGTVFLVVCLYRLIKGHFTTDHHVGFECAIWYWHFVDVVWLFVFIFLYCWGGYRS